MRIIQTFRMSFVSFSVLCLSAVSFLGASFPGSSFRRAVWLMLSPHAFCLCLSPVASSLRSRASAFPVLFCLQLFLFSVLLFLAQAFAGGLVQAFAARSGSCFRRMLSAFVFRRWPQALAVVPLLFLFCSVSSCFFSRCFFSWLMLSPAVLLKLSPRPMLSPAVLLKLSPHAFCLCLSPVASSPRSRASSSSAFPVLFCLQLVQFFSLVNNFNFCFQHRTCSGHRVTFSELTFF
jgi:hypothetical protein